MPSHGTTTTKGYGTAHQKQRRAWEPKVRTGTIPCARCRLTIAATDDWDLGHSDDRTTWTGPEHATCNRAAGGRHRATTSTGQHAGLRHSRTW